MRNAFSNRKFSRGFQSKPRLSVRTGAPKTPKTAIADALRQFARNAVHSAARGLQVSAWTEVSPAAPVDDIRRLRREKLKLMFLHYQPGYRNPVETYYWVRRLPMPPREELASLLATLAIEHAGALERIAERNAAPESVGLSFDRKEALKRHRRMQAYLRLVDDFIETPMHFFYEVAAEMLRKEH